MSIDCHQVDCVVIGGGVVGLAIARQLAADGRDVMLLEKNRALGEETSSRNSEVIHAGIYYECQSARNLDPRSAPNIDPLWRCTRRA